MSTSPKFTPPIDETKVPPEVAQHIRLLYDRAQNHSQAISNHQTQINELKAQIAALQQGK